MREVYANQPEIAQAQVKFIFPHPIMVTCIPASHDDRDSHGGVLGQGGIQGHRVVVESKAPGPGDDVGERAEAEGALQLLLQLGILKREGQKWMDGHTG